jgi:hypothetical protein
VDVNRGEEREKSKEQTEGQNKRMCRLQKERQKGETMGEEEAAVGLLGSEK